VPATNEKAPVPIRPPASRLPTTRRPVPAGQQRTNTPSRPAPAANAAPGVSGEASDASNVHQHAQLRSLAEHGYDLDAGLKASGVETVEGLTREQAKELIIAGRAAIRGAANG
jgi:hypothetical protein